MGHIVLLLGIRLMLEEDGIRLHISTTIYGSMISLLILGHRREVFQLLEEYLPQVSQSPTGASVPQDHSCLPKSAGL